MFDRYVRQVIPEAQSQIVGLKYFNVYGPQEHHKGKMASIFYQLYKQVKETGKARLFKGTDGEGNECYLFVENNGYLAEVMRNDPFFHAYPRFMTDSPVLGEYLSQQRFRSEVQGRDWGVEIRIFGVLKD